MQSDDYSYETLPSAHLSNSRLGLNIPFSTLLWKASFIGFKTGFHIPTKHQMKL
jgi:hypothetical protein